MPPHRFGTTSATAGSGAGQIFPRITEGLVSRTLLPLESNPKRERAKMNRLREQLEAPLPAVLEDDIELPLITDVLPLIDLLLSTGEVAVAMLSTQEIEDCRALLEEAIVETIERGSDDPRSLETLDRLMDWMLNALDLDGASLAIVSTNYDTCRVAAVREDHDGSGAVSRLKDRYRLLFPECRFEYGGFERFANSLPKPRKHYPTF